MIGFIILLLRIFAGDLFFEKIALKLLPVFITLITKQIVNTIASQIVFLNRSSKILALDNFRAFNIFLYFNFYFDCFMGIISAVIRLIKAFIIDILMIPSKLILKLTLFHFLVHYISQIIGLSYSLMGRHYERMDNAYGCYSGFLHM